jgi:hypothetical protein
MADGKVTFEVNATSKGNSLKKTAKDTGDLGKKVKETGRSYNEASGSAGGFHKTEKSMYTTTLNSTKAFSKQAQSIGGSSGLVGAYATLAANVFAASAAFQFLKNAARFDILEQGLVALGNQSGRTLSIVADKLKEVTGAAISTEEAFRSAALGISGGFGSTELQGLAKIAKGASIALGRDLGDAFDRLTRGAIKLEPEILDELGIMVRLDDAVENYAVKLGKSATSLTQLERRQAFMNAILEQGSIKFGNIAEQVDNSPYDRLSAAFGDLTRQIGQFINLTVSPFVTTLSGNIGLLIGASLLLASTFAKQMIPGLLQGGAAAEKSAASLSALAAAKRDAAGKEAIEAAGTLTGSVGAKDARTEIKLIKESNGQRKVSNDLIKSLTRSQASYQTQINKGAQMGRTLTQEEIAAKKVKLSLLQEEIITLKALQNQQITGSTASLAADFSDTQGMLSGSIGDILNRQSGRSGFESIKNLGKDFSDLGGEVGAAFSVMGEESDKAGNKAGKLTKIMGNLKLAGIGAGGAFKLLGSALLNAIPVIGQIIFAGSMLFNLYKKMTFSQAQEDLNKALEDFETILGGVTGKTEEYNRVLASVKDPFLRLTQSYTVASGLIDEVISQLDTVLEKERALAQEEEKNEKKKAERRALPGSGMNASGDTLESYYTKVIEDAKMFSEALGTEIQLDPTLQRQLKESPILDSLLRLRREGPQIVKDVLKNKINVSDLIEGGATADVILGALKKGLDDTKESLKDVGPALEGLKAAFQESEKVFSGFLNNAFPKTKYDKITDSITSTTNEFQTAMLKVAQAYDTTISKDLTQVDFSGLSEALILELGAAAEGVGPTLEKFIDPKFKNAGTNLEKAVNNRSNLLDDITAKEKSLENLSGSALANAEKDLVVMYATEKVLDNKVASSKVLVEGRVKAVGLLGQELESLQEQARTLKSSNAIISNRIKLLSKTIKFGDSLEYTLQEQNKIHEANSSFLQDEIDFYQKQADSTKENADILQYINKLKADKKKIDDSILNVEQINLKVKKAEVKLAQEALKYEKERSSAAQTIAENELKLLNFKRGGELELNTQQTFEAELAAAEEKSRLAIEEAKLRMSLLDVEAAVTKARLMAVAEEIRAKDPAGAAKLDAAANSVGSTIDASRAAIQTTIDSLRSSLEFSVTQAFASSLSDTNMGYVFENLAKVVATRSAAAFEAARLAKLKEGGSKEESVEAGNKAKEEAGKINVGDVKSLITPMTEELKKLGPEGEYVAAATAGVFSIVDAFSMLSQGSLTAGQAIQGTMQIMNAVNSTMQAYSKQRIAEIDKSIAAEQKRDGKSKESLEKIKQFQKKKDEIGRKAFEMDKKFKIATTVMNTATGIMQAYANYEPLTATALAAVIGGLGMAQIGIIKKTQYQSTATDVPSANTALTIGSRSNNVDVAQNATGGELNYLRGGGTSGTNLGGAGGAMGRKGYANGGEGIVVGERGPEVISPASPVDITPNFALGGGTTNVNFSINAVDATGVEDLLVNQRGNIIRMIREAANENGEDFLTQVDPMAYGSNS